MLELNPRIEDKIEAIQFYYTNKANIEKFKSMIEKHKVKIQELENEIVKTQYKINTELIGEYKEVVEFDIKDGKPVSNLVNKKIRKGRLEKLKSFLTEKDEVSAINKFLESIGGEENRVTKEILNIDSFYVGENEYDPRIVSEENLLKKYM